MTDSASSTLQLFDDIQPKLKSGKYSIQATPSLSIQGASLEAKTQHFYVRGPRFKLNLSEDIQSLFPPDKSSGHFKGKLPHITLKKRILPWDRELKNTSSQTPWLALLLLEEDEILYPKKEKPSSTKAATFPVKEVINLNASGILGPKFKLDPGESPDMTCETIDISIETFKAIVPYTEDLPFLAHCRKVDLEHKTAMQIHHKGWFSVVVGNRFGIRKTITKPTKQICHLVSLEGFSDYLKIDPTIPKGIEKLRLVSLASWSYTSLPDEGESFSALGNHLVSDESAEGTQFLYKLPQKSLPKNPTPEQTFANRVLDMGFLPMKYQTRVGSQTAAWYRGPLSPLPVERFTTKLPHFRSSSEAVIYDKDRGMFNLSYAVAWQTGRSMALRSKRFGTDLLNWRRRANYFVDLCSARLRNDGFFDLFKKEKDNVHNWLEKHLISDKFLEYLLSDFSEKIAPRIASKSSPTQPPQENPSKPPTVDDIDTTGLPSNLVEEFKKILMDDRIQSLLKKMVSDEPNIIEWLAETYLLKGLPTNVLIPDSKLIPRESIRFFYLDRAWLDSLIDGAMSVGVQSSKDSLQYAITREIILSGVGSLILEIREKLLGLPIAKSTALGGQISGLLMRSELARNWPGLEIQGFKEKKSLPLLRMEHLSPNLLLCLFPEVPDQVELREPHESLCFGVEEDGNLGKIAKKNADGTSAGQSYTLANDDYRNQRVLNISKLKEHLGCDHSADFALQMIHLPEKITFNTPSGDPS